MKVVYGSKSGKYAENPEFTSIYSQKMHIWAGLIKASNFQNAIFCARIRNSGPVRKTFITGPVHLTISTPVFEQVGGWGETPCLTLAEIRRHLIEKRDIQLTLINNYS